MKKPERLANDPPGFDPVFTDSKNGCPCSHCHVLGRPDCFSAPCFSFLRPERRSVYYTGQTRTTRAPDPLPRKLPAAYRLSPDTKPDGDWVDVSVYPSNGVYVYKRPEGVGSTTLTYAVSDTRFIGYVYPDGSVSGYLNRERGVPTHVRFRV